MSEQNKINVVVPKDRIEPVEIILREGKVPVALDPHEPRAINIDATLDAPARWLQYRISETDQIDQKRCHIIVDREDMSIRLIMNERDHYANRIAGTLEVHPKFVEFGINSDRMWEPNKQGQFFKMNRAFFADKQENMEIVSLLKNFKAKISQDIEKSKEDNGSFSDKFSAVVDSNLPKAFTLNLPMFKGLPEEQIDVELYAEVDGRDVYLSLVSPGAAELMEVHRNQCIDSVLNDIREVAPDIVIIEQ